MTDPSKIKNVPASVRQRLKNWAKAHDTDFNLVLQRYAAERFLHRLGVSSEVDRFTLKGAALFLVWSGKEFRATRDIDLLGTGAEDQAAIREAMTAICVIEDPRDGLAFDPAAIRIDEIRHDQGYGSVRVKLEARLGNVKIPLQVDIGFGDAIHPGREETEYPTLLDHAAPRIWIYPRETTIAEKFEAMVRLGVGNSRMKDFWDVVALSQEFEFDGETLRTAIDETFRRRGTLISQVVPEALRPAFYRDVKRDEMWRAFRQKSGLQLEVPEVFTDAGEQVIAFLGPVRESLAGDDGFLGVWRKGGPWQTDFGQGGFGGGEHSGHPPDEDRSGE